MKSFLFRTFKPELLKYLLISYFSILLNLVLNILSIKYLSVKDLGKVALGKTIFQSFDFSHFGIRFGLDRLLPSINSNNQRIEVFGVAYLSSLVFSLLFVVFWFVYNLTDSWFYCTFYLSGFINTLIMVYRIFYRAKELKTKFINITLVVNLLPILLQVIGLYIWNIYGLIMCGLLGYLTSFIFIIIQYGIKLQFRIRRGWIILRGLFRRGFVLFVSGVVTFFSTIGDRFFIEGYWGLEVLGIFSVIMFVFSVFNIFAVNYTEMIMNRIVREKSFDYALIQVFKLLTITTILVLICYTVIPYFVNMLIPSYSKYIEQMRKILIGAIPFSCLPIFNHYLHSIDKRRVLLIINIFCTSIYFCALYLILNKDVSLDKLILLKNSFYSLIALITFIFAYYFSKLSMIRKF